jgi:hypothetical protein
MSVLVWGAFATLGVYALGSVAQVVGTGSCWLSRRCLPPSNSCPQPDHYPTTTDVAAWLELARSTGVSDKLLLTEVDF